MDSWNRFNETSLPHKKDFYSRLNIKSIIDIDYIQATRVFKEFKMNNLGDYHDFMFKAIPYFLLIYLKILEICISKYMSLIQLTLPGFARHACLKITGVNLELITDINMLLMIESGMRGGVCHVIHSYAEGNNKYINNYDENKEPSFLSYLDSSTID